jgi:DNA-binding transcriptional ArsR family regulator
MLHHNKIVTMSNRDSKTIGSSMAETRERHVRYLRAVNNPLRRKILNAIKDGYRTIEELKSNLGLDETTLDWHMKVLEHGFCVEKEEQNGRTVYKLTEEGEVIDFMDK